MSSSRPGSFGLVGILTAAAAVLAAGGTLALGGQPGSAPAPAGGTEILGAGSYWRWHVTHRKPAVDPEADGKKGAAPEPLPMLGDNSNFRGCDHDESAPPPREWPGPDFDDSAWPRTSLAWMHNAQGAKLSQAALSIRGKFAVADPAVALTLTVKYRGGVRVLLNGREVARAHLPAGELGPDTPGEPYPADAYLDAKGEIINMRGGKIAEDDKPRVAGRDRTLGPVKLPADALRKGVNVLAVEIRRSLYHPATRRWWKYPAETGKYPWWRTGELLSLSLAAAGPGATPNVGRPAGAQVWVQDRNDRVYGPDYGDPGEPLEKYPLRIAGARNAPFCAQLVVGSGAPLRGVAVTPGELKAVKGPGSIAAKNVDVLYALPADARNVGRWFRDLSATAPAEAAPGPAGAGALQPVLVRVRVPADAPAGDYRGEVAVAAGGATFKVPLELSVADWAVPGARSLRTYVGIYHSPISVALQYKCEPWSDAHFKKMEKSIDLLARLGNRMVNIPVLDETQFGEPEGMIRWVKKAGGPSAGSGQAAYDYDFSTFDRYMKMIVDRCGRQDYVCLQVWHAGGWEVRSIDNKCTVPAVEAGSDKRSALQVPRWGTPEAVAFWKPFFAAVQERLAKLDMPKAMCVGILSDSTAPEEVFKTLGEASPGGQARWHRGCHGMTDSKTPYAVGKAGGNVVALHEHCYGMSMVRPEAWRLPMHEQRGWPGTAYFRVSNHEHSTGWHDARTDAERALWTRKQGLGRICLDFWPVMKGARGEPTDVYNRYPHSSCAQREPSLKSLTWPGPEGAETTLRFEADCEGLAAAEALVAVSEALFTRKDQLGAELAAECEKAMAERLAWLWRSVEGTGGHFHTYHYGWQDLNRRLFDCAAAAAKKAK